MIRKILFLMILTNIATFQKLVAFGQRVSTNEIVEQTGQTILIDNFYQIDVNDNINFCKSSSIGFLEKEKCYIQNFQTENKLKGQLLIQIDFSGKIQFLGISKVFIDKYKRITKPKMILTNYLEECVSGINSNWQIANCLSNKIVDFISD